jgi:lipoprotein-anchoring transpeptidase ErfK/SrfK
VHASVKNLIAVVILVLVGGLAAGRPAVAGASDATAAATSRAAADPGLTLTATPMIVRAGRQVTMAAHIAVPGATLQLSRMRADEVVFRPLTTVTVDASGIATWLAQPARSCTYRVEFAGDAGAVWAPATAEAAVRVRPLIRLALVPDDMVVKGRSVSARIHVRPAHPGGLVQLQVWDRAAQVWTVRRTLTLNADSSVRSSWATDAVGRLRVRVHMLADADHAPGTSRLRELRVLDPRNPYGVPTRYAHLILVDLSQYKLYYHEHGNIVRVFDCVLGRPSLPTPRGHFRIYAKDAHMSGPYGPHRMRYLGLYAIHGTDEPWLLNRFPRNYSHGCTRLSNAHIRWLFPRCPVGTPVWNVP